MGTPSIGHFFLFQGLFEIESIKLYIFIYIEAFEISALHVVILCESVFVVFFSPKSFMSGLIMIR